MSFLVGLIGSFILDFLAYFWDTKTQDQSVDETTARQMRPYESHTVASSSARRYWAGLPVSASGRVRTIRAFTSEVSSKSFFYISRLRGLNRYIDIDILSRDIAVANVSPG